MPETVNLWSSFFPYIAMFVVFYFILIIPQRRREKQFREMMGALKEGDNITTIGGVIGKITHMSNDELSIESGLERTKIKIAKWAVKSVDKVQEAAK